MTVSSTTSRSLAVPTGLPAFALRSAEDEGRFEAEGWRVRKDGSRFWASVVIEPMFQVPDCLAMTR